MAYQDIATVNISLQTAGVTSQGFGTPLFASAHRYFSERVRAYTSLTQAAEDLPTSSNAYKAIQAFFGNTPAPSVVKIGRREADLELTVAAGATTGSLTVFASDGTDTESVVVSVTGQLDEDAVATAIAAAIEGSLTVGPLVVASAVGDTISIDVAASGYTFWVKNLSSNLTEAYNTTETAAELIAALTLEDDDYYFFTADDHTETFVLAAAADIEARTKMYFVSTQQATSLTAYNEGAATDILGKLKDTGYFRTKGMFSHTADTLFPECAYVGYNAPFDAGSITWTNLKVSIAAGQNPTTGNVLSTTEKGYLFDRDAAVVEKIGGLNVLRNGKTASGEKISTVRGRDSLTVALETAYTNLLVNQQGTKIPFNNSGISKLEGTCRNVLTRYVVSNFINDNFVTDFPNANLVPVEDKANGIYQLGTFTAELSGAIEIVRITGTLTLNLEG